MLLGLILQERNLQNVTSLYNLEAGSFGRAQKVTEIHDIPILAQLMLVA
jgi:hypothetical protein